MRHESLTGVSGEPCLVLLFSCLLEQCDAGSIAEPSSLGKSHPTRSITKLPVIYLYEAGAQTLQKMDHGCIYNYKVLDGLCKMRWNRE